MTSQESLAAISLGAEVLPGMLSQIEGELEQIAGGGALASRIQLPHKL